MSTRKLSLLTMTAALALTASFGATTAAFAAPPPSPPDVSSPADGSPKPDALNAPDVQNAPETHNVPAGPSSDTASPAQPAKPAHPAAKPASKSLAKDGTNVLACLDARCEVEVRNGQEIKLDGKYGVEEIEVELSGGGQATLIIREGNSEAIASMSTAKPGATTVINGVRISAHQSRQDMIILTISHS